MNAFTDYQKKIDQVIQMNQDRVAIDLLTKNNRIDTLSYAQIKTYILECAKIKAENGWKDGERILVMSDINVNYFLTFVALSYNHLSVVLADPHLPARELLSLINQCEVSAAFCDKKNTVVLEEQDLTIYETYSIYGGAKLLRKSETVKEYPLTPKDSAIIFSSGTTSTMKAVEISYDYLIYSLPYCQEAIVMEDKYLSHGTILLVPMTHISGLGVAMTCFLSQCKLDGVEVINSTILKKSIDVFEPSFFGIIPRVYDVFYDVLTEQLKLRHVLWVYKALEGITVFCMNKLHIRYAGRFFLAPFRKALFGKHMKVLGAGGAPWQTASMQHFMNMGYITRNIYSGTECALYICVGGIEEKTPENAIGKYDCHPRVQIIIGDPDEEGIGEIRVKTPFIMNGYYGDPEATKNAFDENGYFKTGDSGYIDEDGFLFLTGRQKESIVLQSGKKVAPNDLTEIFSEVLSGFSHAFVGVKDVEEDYDLIHLFIEDTKMSQAERSELEGKIASFQRQVAPLYPIKKVHYIQEIPRTKLEKNKLYVLRDIVQKEQLQENGKEVADKKVLKASKAKKKVEDDILAEVLSMIREEISYEEEMTGSENLKDDLGMDSLGILNLCTQLEGKYHVEIGKYIGELQNAKRIVEYIKAPDAFISENIEEEDLLDAYDYPHERKRIHKLVFRFLVWLSNRTYRIKTKGLEHITPGEQYIYCPNHQTHLDGMWMYSAMGKRIPDVNKIGCMAKKEHLDRGISRFFLTMLGGIPVDRSGNPTGSIKRTIDFVKEGNSFLIHPEGTRTRDGVLGTFKPGSAQISKETGVPIIPVTIIGGYEIFPHDHKVPIIRNNKGKKPVLKIIFSKPIYPENKSVQEITDELERGIRGNIEHYKR